MRLCHLAGLALTSPASVRVAGMKPPVSFYSNCPFGCAYLLLSGVGKQVVLAPGGTREQNHFRWLIPWHMGVLTERGSYVSFCRDLPHHQNPWGGWWFLGRFRALRRDRWRAAIERRGPVKVLPAWRGIALCVAGYLVLFIPWTFVWAAYTPAWTLYWFARAVARHLRRGS